VADYFLVRDVRK